MERKLASIQKVSKVDQIENADKIEVARVLGWSVVVPKGQLKENDLVCFFEIDSLLPRRKYSEFLFKGEEEKVRLKTVRLRGQISQGLVIPLTDVLSAEGLTLKMSAIIDSDTSKTVLDGYKIGTDLTELLKIEKYEPYIPAQLQGMIKNSFPSFLIKTDETRIQSEPQVLDRYKGERFYISEKLDGSSMTVYLKDGEFGVCSRNLELKETDTNTQWKVARELKIEEKLKEESLNNFCLQGELIGEGIQKNKYKLKGQTFRVFNVFDILNYRYLDLDELIEFCSRLELETVPILDSDFELNHSVEDLVELSKGKSKLNEDSQREGLVIRPMQEKRDPDLGRLSFKVINPEFLIKYGE